VRTAAAISDDEQIVTVATSLRSCPVYAGLVGSVV
jgi:hypothetical protein